MDAPNHLVLVSQRSEDVDFAAKVAGLCGSKFVQVTNRADLKNYFKRGSKDLLFWDADHEDSSDVHHPLSVGAFRDFVAKTIPPVRVMAITDKGLHLHRLLIDKPIYCNHMMRRFQSPAAELVARLMAASQLDAPTGASRYFPKDAEHQKFELGRSLEKGAIVEAIRGYFIKKGVVDRLSAFVAQATDELIMNSIFDAPPPVIGKISRRHTQRNADFPLSDKERVEVEVICAEGYAAVSVADNFGTLTKEAVFPYVVRDYQNEAYFVRNSDPGAGLGLRSIYQSGLSLLFVAQREKRTEVTVFVPLTDSFKDFRNQFRFLGLLVE